MTGGAGTERSGGFWFFYETVLVWLEKAAALVLLSIILVSGVMGAVGPKFGYTGNVEAKHRMVICSVYLCLLGAVIATRKCKHIAVDAITPHIAERFRVKLEGLLMLVGAFAVILVAYKSGQVPEKTVSSSLRVPVMIAFYYMGFHFIVTGVGRLVGVILGEVEGMDLDLDEAPSGLTGTPEETSGEAEVQVDDTSDATEEDAESGEEPS
jgi:TRAP-type C4-dicarboxylate transport system permease small subunit